MFRFLSLKKIKARRRRAPPMVVMQIMLIRERVAMLLRIAQDNFRKHVLPLLNDVQEMYLLLTPCCWRKCFPYVGCTIR